MSDERDDRPHADEGEKWATLIMTRHSNQLSMEEVRTLAYDISDALTESRNELLEQVAHHILTFQSEPQWLERHDADIEQRRIEICAEHARRADGDIAVISAERDELRELLEARCERCQQERPVVYVETGFAGEREMMCGPCISAERAQQEVDLDRARAEGARDAYLKVARNCAALMKRACPTDRKIGYQIVIGACEKAAANEAGRAAKGGA